MQKGLWLQKQYYYLRNSSGRYTNWWRTSVSFFSFPLLDMQNFAKAWKQPFITPHRENLLALISTTGRNLERFFVLCYFLLLFNCLLSLSRPSTLLGFTRILNISQAFDRNGISVRCSYFNRIFPYQAIPFSSLNFIFVWEPKTYLSPCLRVFVWTTN